MNLAQQELTAKSSILKRLNKNRPANKLHCGCSGMGCLCSFLDHHVITDTDALPCLSADREIRNDNMYQTLQTRIKKLSCNE
jgi:hypothetical protein